VASIRIEDSQQTYEEKTDGDGFSKEEEQGRSINEGNGPFPILATT